MLKISKIDFMAIFGLTLLYSIVTIVMYSNLLSLPVCILALTMIYVSLLMTMAAGKANLDNSILILVPLIITSFQNIFLGINVDFITNTSMSFLVMVNYLYSCFLLLFLFVFMHRSQTLIKTMIILVIITIYGGILFFVHPANLTGFLSAYRNISCPIIFFMIGMLLSPKVKMQKICKLIGILFIIVFIIGLYERFIDTDFWIRLNIGEIWNKKGIFYNILTGKPYNHYSAEIFFGQAQQRMVSSFGEPVNLGTFCVLVFHLSWWNKKYILSAMAFIACVLTVSKGALLGILLLIVIYSFYKFDRKSFLGVSIIFALLFLLSYVTLNSAGGSVAIHINGLLHSFDSLIINPIGIGLGNAGVYGNLFAVLEKNMIQESGLGVILGQLGIIGMVCYFLFFFYQYRCIHLSRNDICIRDKILSYTLIYSFILLIIFSESALGPNASAGYMMLIGVICGKIERGRGGHEEVL